ncbi:hypothetical protein GCM10025734_60360 [Kitasatospora paranensis]
MWRRSDTRPSVLSTVDALTAGVGDLGLHAPDAWLPDSDPYKPAPTPAPPRTRR